MNDSNYIKLIRFVNNTVHLTNVRFILFLFFCYVPGTFLTSRTLWQLCIFRGDTTGGHHFIQKQKKYKKIKNQLILIYIHLLVRILRSGKTFIPRSGKSLHQNTNSSTLFCPTDFSSPRRLSKAVWPPWPMIPTLSRRRSKRWPMPCARRWTTWRAWLRASSASDPSASPPRRRDAPSPSLLRPPARRRRPQASSPIRLWGGRDVQYP